jgi:hypothetical protein
MGCMGMAWPLAPSASAHGEEVNEYVAFSSLQVLSHGSHHPGASFSPIPNAVDKPY